MGVEQTVEYDADAEWVQAGDSSWLPQRFLVKRSVVSRRRPRRGRDRVSVFQVVLGEQVIAFVPGVVERAEKGARLAVMVRKAVALRSSRIRRVLRGPVLAGS